MSIMPVDKVDQTAVLRTLNLNPTDPRTQALLLICQRYGLDPLLKHVVLIDGKPYVTRDGYLHVAHTSEQFDGIEIIDEGETDTHWWARASTHRKDMQRPFTYRGRYSKKGANTRYGPEMAVKCAEVASLRRAFNVTGVAAADERWTDDHEDPEPAATITSAEAKRRLLARVGGDKEAAVAAWDRAGLTDHRYVTDAEYNAAVDEHEHLAWTWGRPSGPGEHEPGGRVELDTPGPHTDGRGAGASTVTTPTAADNRVDAVVGREGDVEPDPPQAPSPPTTIPKIAMRASHVFRQAYDDAPNRQKTRTLDRLRHALTYACSNGQHTSLTELTNEQLLDVVQPARGHQRRPPHLRLRPRRPRRCHVHHSDRQRNHRPLDRPRKRRG